MKLSRARLLSISGKQRILPFSDLFAYSDGLLVGGWETTNSAWSIVSGKAVCSPTLGEELLTDGNMETGDPPNNWTANNGAILAASATERTGGSGTKSLSITNGVANTANATHPVTVTDWAWVQLSGWLTNSYAECYATNLNRGVPIMRFNSTTLLPSWTNKKLTGYKSGGVGVTCKLTTGTIGQQTFYDDISVKEIMYSDMLLTRNFGITDFDISVSVHLDPLTYKSQAGLVACVDSPTSPLNLIEAYHDRTNIHLKTKVAGVYPAELINVASTYSDGAIIRLKGHRSGANLLLDLFYNGSQVGTQKTVSDAGIINNTRHGLFSASDLNQIDSFSIARYS